MDKPAKSYPLCWLARLNDICSIKHDLEKSVNRTSIHRYHYINFFQNVKFILSSQISKFIQLMLFKVHAKNGFLSLGIGQII